MSALHEPSLRRRTALLAGCGTVLVALCFLLSSITAAGQGFLLAFAIWCGFPLGAMALLAIHVLTGGAWGDAIGARLRAGAWLTALVAVSLVLVLACQHAIYPWARGFVDPSVAKFYLRPSAFTLRAVVFAGGCIAFAVLLATRRATLLWAGVALAFYGLGTSFIALDWFVSLDPFHGVTTYGAMIGIVQLMTALAIAALFLPGDVDRETVNDLGQLLVAMLLAIAYLELMTYVVMWYGDLPDKVEWYVRRSAEPWRGVLIVTIVLALVCFAALVPRRLRESAPALRVICLVLLVTIALHWVWIIGPEFVRPMASIIITLVSFVAFLLLSAAVMMVVPQPTPEPRAISRNRIKPPSPPASQDRARVVTRGRALAHGSEAAQEPGPRPVEHAGNVAENLQPAGVATKVVLVTAFGFLVFVGISVGGLGFFYARDAKAPPASSARSEQHPPLAFPVAEATTSRRDALAHIDPRIAEAMAAVVARGTAAYDPSVTAGVQP